MSVDVAKAVDTRLAQRTSRRSTSGRRFALQMVIPSIDALAGLGALVLFWNGYTSNLLLGVAVFVAMNWGFNVTLSVAALVYAGAAQTLRTRHG